MNIKKLPFLVIICSMVTPPYVNAAKKNTSKQETPKKTTKKSEPKPEVKEYFTKLEQEYKETTRNKTYAKDVPQMPLMIPPTIAQDGSAKTPYPQDSLVTDMKSIKEIIHCTAPQPEPISDIIHSRKTPKKKK